MLYFVPAWYQQNMWRESEQSWHTRRMHTEFDDTVKQVQMFNRSGKRDFKILLLSHTPNFRHFLHRQGVIHAPYWCVFDAIQEVERKKASVFSFHNLDWPEHIEFVYTPFVVMAFLNHEKYAEINFGEAGNPIEVSMFKDNALSRKNIYDDRGFVSSTEVYTNGDLVYTDYLTEKGIVKLRVYAETGAVEVNDASNTYLIFDGKKTTKRTFERLYYNSIDDVVLEVLHANMTTCTPEDIFCVAMHPLNVKAMGEFINRRCVLSFYQDRYRIRSYTDSRELVKKARYIITDSEATTRYLKREMEVELPNIIDISPYDSRMDFGISSQLTVQKILVPVDDLPPERFTGLIIALAKYITTNENAMVHIFTRKADFDLPDKLLHVIGGILKQLGMDKRMALPEEDEDDTAENDSITEAGAEEVPVRFFVEQCVDELSVSKCIREQRIMIDMRHNPDLYLQINCISSAIPQIVRRETQYMQDGLNGFVITDLGKIPEALDFFLGSLANWNQAKVHSYDIAQKFTTRHLLAKWDEVIASTEK